MAKPVCLLDFDGVMNRITGSGYDPRHPRLDPQLVKSVALLVRGCGLDVVVSSSWREAYTLDQLRDILRRSCLLQFGENFGAWVADAMVGVTPIYERIPKRLYLRNREVQDWLTKHRPDAAYVIIDDSSEHGFPTDRFVNVHGKLGFSLIDLVSAREILAAQGVACRDVEIKT